MLVNVVTKFNVGDEVFRKFLDDYLPIEILGIEVHVNKKYEIEVNYLFKPYSDRCELGIIREDQVFFEYEINNDK
jgi:hypothetical protein